MSSIGGHETREDKRPDGVQKNDQIAFQDVSIAVNVRVGSFQRQSLGRLQIELPDNLCDSRNSSRAIESLPPEFMLFQ